MNAYTATEDSVGSGTLEDQESVDSSAKLAAATASTQAKRWLDLYFIKLSSPNFNLSPKCLAFSLSWRLGDLDAGNSTGAQS